MKIFFEYLMYFLIPLIVIWRGMKMKKALKNEMIKGNIKPISHTWKTRIYPDLKKVINHIKKRK